MLPSLYMIAAKVRSGIPDNNFALFSVMRDAYLKILAPFNGFDELPQEFKTPYWQMRHNPSNHLELLLYYNGSYKLPSKDIEVEVKSRLKSKYISSPYYLSLLESLRLTAYNYVVMQITQFSSHLSADDLDLTDRLPFLICQGLFRVPSNQEQTPCQYSDRPYGTVGLILRGDLGDETGLLAVTSAHVVLGPDHRASLDETDQRSYSDGSHRLEAAARELNSDWHIETNKYSGHFRTVGPPAFSYRQYHDSSNRELHWYETFLQDLALLKINTTSKNIRVGQYFNHLKTCQYPGENNEIAPFYTKVLGIESESKNTCSRNVWSYNKESTSSTAV